MAKTRHHRFKPLAIFCGCTTCFVPDMFGNPEDRFCHDVTQMAEYAGSSKSLLIRLVTACYDDLAKRLSSIFYGC